MLSWELSSEYSPANVLLSAFIFFCRCEERSDVAIHLILILNIESPLFGDNIIRYLDPRVRGEGEYGELLSFATKAKMVRLRERWERASCIVNGSMSPTNRLPRGCGDLGRYNFFSTSRLSICMGKVARQFLFYWYLNMI